MTSRWSMLPIAGLSALLLVAGAGPAHAADDLGGVYDTWCDLGNGRPINPQDSVKRAQDQFSDTGILEFHRGYSMSPLDFRGKDPTLGALRVVLNPHSTFGPKGNGSWSDADMLRAFRYYRCNNIVAFKTEFDDQYKTRTSDSSLKMKPGYETDEKIEALDHQAYLIMKQALKDEQQRQGLEVTVFKDDKAPDDDDL